MRPIRLMNLKNGFNVDWLLNKVQHNLELVETDMHDIARRLREYDPTYFILRSKTDGRYEIHNTENIGSTYCMVIPWPVLDERTLDLVRKTDTHRIGVKIRQREIEEEERKAEEAREKELKTAASNMAQETHYHFKEAFKLL